MSGDVDRMYLCRAAWFLGRSPNICEAANSTCGWSESTANLERIHSHCGWVQVSPKSDPPACLVCDHTKLAHHGENGLCRQCDCWAFTGRPGAITVTDPPEESRRRAWWDRIQYLFIVGEAD